MEAPSQLLRIDDSPRPGAGQHGELEPTAVGRSIEEELAAIVTEFDCSHTLETGPSRGSSALAIAAVHARRGHGGHIAICPRQESGSSSDAVERLGGAEVFDRVQVIPSSSEVALPGLLGDGIELDFALIQGPKRFEELFVEFLYLDRMLVTGGIIALGSREERAVAAVLGFVAQARAYELRMEAGSELAVLRKLGQQRSPETLFPSGWDPPANRGERDHSFVTGNGAVASGLAVPYGAAANGSPLQASSTRELHAARVRGGELEARVAELGTRLLDAEQRAAELLRTRARVAEADLDLQHAERKLRQTELEVQRGERELRQTQLELQQAHRAEYWLACVNASASWRLTAPLRAVKNRARALLGR